MINVEGDDPKLTEWKKQAEESKTRMISDG
jgi:hypothetical protein